MKKFTIFASIAAAAAGITWLFTTDKGKAVRQSVADKTKPVLDAITKAVSKEQPETVGPQGSALTA